VTNNDNVNNKQLIWEYWQTMNGDIGGDDASPYAKYVHDEIFWQGPHPINILEGKDSLISGFWGPLFNSFPDIRREPYILMGGEFRGEMWVSGTGHFRGIFRNDWLGIPATGKETTIRFGEFCKIADGKIKETYIILDIPDVMHQAGYDVLAPCLGQEGFVPGPKTEDGILLEQQDPKETEKSLTLVEAMLAGLADYDGSDSLDSMRQERFWDPDMIWYGPHGIGTTYGLKGFQDHHQRPFLEAFPDRLGGNHICRHADGLYVASTGWPSLRGTHRGTYKGVEPTGKTVAMRVMDWWRRQGDRLVENWVFIDMIDLFLQMDVDLFAEMQKQIRSR
jgi:predicted ester cyclase